MHYFNFYFIIRMCNKWAGGKKITQTNESNDISAYYAPVAESFFVYETGLFIKIVSFKNIYSFEHYCGINYEYSQEEIRTNSLELSIKEFMNMNSYEVLTVLLGQDLTQLDFELIRKDEENYYRCRSSNMLHAFTVYEKCSGMFYGK